MYLFSLPTALLVLLPSLLPSLVRADVEFTSPAAGEDVPEGTINVSWKESGASPPISNLAAYTLVLMTGGNEDGTMLSLATFVSQGTFQSGNKASGTISAGIAGPAKNGFFFQIISSSATGAEVINYSDRFSITGLTGTTPAEYLNAVTELDGTTTGPGGPGDAASSSATGEPTRTSMSTVPTIPAGLSAATSAAGSSSSVPVSGPDSNNGSDTNSAGSGISTGALIGIAIAGAAVGIIGIATALWVCLRRRKSRQVEEIKIGDGMNQSQDHLRREMSFASPPQPPVELDPYATIVEAGDGACPAEADSMHIRAELEGDSIHWHGPEPPLTPVPDTPLECLTLDSTRTPTPTLPGNPVIPRSNV